MEEARNDNNAQPPPQQQADEREDERWLENMRGSLMVVATVIASITYQAGLNPPGGVWQDNKYDSPKHVAGEAIAVYETPSRYFWFVYFNNISFALSLATILVLMRRGGVYRSKTTMQVLKAQMIGSIITLTIAYALGCPSLGEYRRMSIPLTVLCSLFYGEILVFLSNWILARRLGDFLNRIRNQIGSRVILCLKGSVLLTTMFLFTMNLRTTAIMVIGQILMVLGCLLWWIDIKEDA